MNKHLGYGIKISPEARLRMLILSSYAHSVWKTARYVVRGEEHIRRRRSVLRALCRCRGLSVLRRRILLRRLDLSR